MKTIAFRRTLALLFCKKLLFWIFFFSLLFLIFCFLSIWYPKLLAFLCFCSSVGVKKAARPLAFILHSRLTTEDDLYLSLIIYTHTHTRRVVAREYIEYSRSKIICLTTKPLRFLRSNVMLISNRIPKSFHLPLTNCSVVRRIKWKQKRTQRRSLSSPLVPCASVAARWLFPPVRLRLLLLWGCSIPADWEEKNLRPREEQTSLKMVLTKANS